MDDIGRQFHLNHDKIEKKRLGQLQVRTSHILARAVFTSVLMKSGHFNINLHIVRCLNESREVVKVSISVLAVEESNASAHI